MERPRGVTLIYPYLNHMLATPFSPYLSHTCWPPLSPYLSRMLATPVSPTVLPEPPLSLLPEPYAGHPCLSPLEDSLLPPSPGMARGPSETELGRYSQDLPFPIRLSSQIAK